jgi:hypothetical protein
MSLPSPEQLAALRWRPTPRRPTVAEFELAPECDCCEAPLGPMEDVLCRYCLDQCVDDEDRVGFDTDVEVAR